MNKQTFECKYPDCKFKTKIKDELTTHIKKNNHIVELKWKENIDGINLIEYSYISIG
jgi:phage FluMu protein Com